MDKLLYKLCEHNVNIMSGWYPVPARILAENIGITVNQARYRLNKLRKEGLVEVITQMIGDDEGSLPYRGWHITQKAEETEEFKKAMERERKICKEVFDIDIGE